MPDPLLNAVRRRAGFRCEYCHLPEHVFAGTFENEHVIAIQHGGSNAFGNRAYCCVHCNRRKGPNLASIDWSTSRTRLVRLFNPRRHKWDSHFRWDGPVLIGITAIGRVTVSLLFINNPMRIDLRRLLLADRSLRQ